MARFGGSGGIVSSTIGYQKFISQWQPLKKPIIHIPPTNFHDEILALQGWHGEIFIA
jgi:hypothetical protein